MSSFNTKCSIALAFLALTALQPFGGGALADQAALRCTEQLTHYVDAIKQLDALVVRARMAAADNPLHESDVQYYVSALTDAKQCAQRLLPVATASR
jgi:hypothetical protein